jgi:hypothetical protein
METMSKNIPQLHPEDFLELDIDDLIKTTNHEFNYLSNFKKLQLTLQQNEQAKKYTRYKNISLFLNYQRTIMIDNVDLIPESFVFSDINEWNELVQNKQKNKTSFKKFKICVFTENIRCVFVIYLIKGFQGYGISFYDDNNQYKFLVSNNLLEIINIIVNISDMKLKNEISNSDIVSKFANNTEYMKEKRYKNKCTHELAMRNKEDLRMQKIRTTNSRKLLYKLHNKIREVMFELGDLKTLQLFIAEEFPLYQEIDLDTISYYSNTIYQTIDKIGDWLFDFNITNKEEMTIDKLALELAIINLEQCEQIELFNLAIMDRYQILENTEKNILMCRLKFYERLNMKYHTILERCREYLSPDQQLSMNKVINMTYKLIMFKTHQGNVKISTIRLKCQMHELIYNYLNNICNEIENAQPEIENAQQEFLEDSSNTSQSDSSTNASESLSIESSSDELSSDESSNG